MKLHDIEAEIEKLPDAEVKELVKWLSDHRVARRSSRSPSGEEFSPLNALIGEAEAARKRGLMTGPAVMGPFE